jgi:uncharacterized protein DUF4136
MPRPSATVFAWCAAVVIAAAGTAAAQTFKLPKAEVDYDHAVDFTAFHTFQWKEGQEPLPNPANNMSLVTAIERELAKKGLKKETEGTADLRVRFYAALEKHLRGAGRQSETPYMTGDLRTSVDIEKMSEGTLIIELYRGDTQNRVWRGSTVKVFRSGAMNEELIRSAVSLILRGYPPSPASPSPASPAP